MKKKKPKPGKRKPSFAARLKKIKCLALDIDGILTDSTAFWIQGQGWTRSFSIRDGYGIKLLQAAGLEIALISGGASEDVRERARSLAITRLYLGNEDKITSLRILLQDAGLQADQVAYMGDELFDLPVLRAVGVSGTVSDAVEDVRREVDYVAKAPAGRGAVREFIELIRKAQGHKNP